MIASTCKEDIQSDAMPGPKHCYHVHWEFQPGEFHACKSENYFLVINSKF